VPKDQAGRWLQYLAAECADRGWYYANFGQMDSDENSGSITVRAGQAVPCPECAVVWERRRGGPLKVKARPAGASELPLEQARSFLDRVNERCKANVLQRLYRRGLLEYKGLAWRGEHWLDDTVRLGPPARQDERALVGPRVVWVDALLDCIGPGDSPHALLHRLKEVAAFLTVVTGGAFRLPATGSVWTFTPDLTGCEVRALGYFETEVPKEMPARGACRPVPLRPVARPDFSLRGIDGSTNERWLSADTVDLWAAYSGLDPERRQQFFQAASKWQQALTHWVEERTLSVALMVVACESLKPPEKRYNDHNVYDVVEFLLGKPVADSLQEPWSHPQGTRNAHFHRGELRGGEFARRAVLSSFEDPAFDLGCRVMADVTQAALIEWLRRGGTVTLPALKSRRSRRWRATKRQVLVLLGLVAAASAVVGWFCRGLLAV
jgi:hypothetical protein